MVDGRLASRGSELRSQFRRGGAEIEPIKTSAARWIAADAVAWIEVPRPELVIDRLTDPRVENYLKVLPQYQKYRKKQGFPRIAQCRRVGGHSA